jgi:ABC-type glycerol-3-phosphate transport system substrate-binding protein
MKVLTLMFVLALSTSVFACGGSDKTSDTSTTTTTSTDSDTTES